MRINRVLRLVLASCVLAVASLVVQPGVAAADNCGTAEDTCQGTFIGGAAAAVGASAIALAAAATGRAIRGNRPRPPQWDDTGDGEP